MTNEARSMPFSISGETITSHVRQMVLSSNWRGALEVLTDGSGMSHEYAYEILKGNAALEGNSGEGIFLVEDGPQFPETAKYLSTFSFQNCGLLRRDGQVLRPKYRVAALDEEDFRSAGLLLGTGANGTPDFLRARVMYYLLPDVAANYISVPSAPVTDTLIDFRNRAVAEQVIVWEGRDPAPWATIHDDDVAAATEFFASRIPSSIGAGTELFDLKESDPDEYLDRLIKATILPDSLCQEREKLIMERHLREIAKFKAQIEVQAGPIGGEGWFRLPVFMEGKSGDMTAVDRYVDVPKAPFLFWALRPLDPSEMGFCEKWVQVTSSGYKCTGDDPYHTDWIVGAGMDPDRFYSQHEDVSNASFQYRLELNQKLLNFDFACLSTSSLEFVNGRIKHIKPGDILEPGDIGVIASAGVEYDAALRSAAKHASALICLTGGPLAHAATVGRELNVPILLWEGAEHIPDGTLVSIDLQKRKINIDIY